LKNIEVIKASTVKGMVTAPASKSMMQRAVAACFLADLFESVRANMRDGGRSRRQCRILNSSDCDDLHAAVEIVRAIENGEKIIDCGESGLSFRMFAPIAALFDKEFIFTGHGSLSKRPVDMVEKALKKLGAGCRSNKGFLPVDIKGPIKAGKIKVDGSVTSQLLTGLLMALPCCDGDSEITVTNLKSRPYVEMTLKLLGDFGIKIQNVKFKTFKIKGGQRYKPVTYRVEGDWSGAAFLLVAGAVGGSVRVNNLNYKKSLQADKAIINALKLCGAKIKIGPDHVEVCKKNGNSVKKSSCQLKGFKFNAEDCPDLFPPLAALAVHCKGKTVITGVNRLKHKESDRGKVLRDELTKMGALIKIKGNKMEITGSQLKGGIVDSHNDHRIAMACAVAGIGSKSCVQINGAESVSKSYPDFFEDLGSIIR
jgi:3-phosphoshikimate 1-carboxyvinyltransferase